MTETLNFGWKPSRHFNGRGLLKKSNGTRKGVVVIRRELDPEGLQKREGGEKNHEKGGEPKAKLDDYMTRV